MGDRTFPSGKPSSVSPICYAHLLLSLFPTTIACTWWNRPEEDLAIRIHLIHPGPSSSRSMFFMGSSLLYAATLTHYSTVPLTTGPDYDCSVCLKNATSQGTSYLCTRCLHWVHSRCSGLRNASDYRKANGWICTACITPPRPRTHSPPPSPHTRPPCQTSRSTYYSGTPMVSAIKRQN